MIETLYETTLTSQHFNFVRDLWTFDKTVLKLAKRLFNLIISKVYKLRKKFLRDIKSWQTTARKNFDDLKIYENENDDPFWKSELMRSKQKLFLGVDNQDYDFVTSTNLDFIWTYVFVSLKFFRFEYHFDLNWIKWFFNSVTNVVPSTMMITLKIFMNFKLLFRVRNAVKDAINPTPKLSFNIKIFEKQSFMLSMYVETFRFFVQVFVTQFSSHTAVHINNWLLSRNKINMMNSHSTHMNAEIWNIKNNVHFFDKYWVERFLVDFNDFWNDSIKMNATDHANADSKKSIYSMNEVRFSLEDLKGS